MNVGKVILAGCILVLVRFAGAQKDDVINVPTTGMPDIIPNQSYNLSWSNPTNGYMVISLGTMPSVYATNVLIPKNGMTVRSSAQYAMLGMPGPTSFNNTRIWYFSIVDDNSTMISYSPAVFVDLSGNGTASLNASATVTSATSSGTTTTSPPGSVGQSSGLSSQAVIGVAVGCSLGCLVLIALVFFLVRKKRSARRRAVAVGNKPVHTSGWKEVAGPTVISTRSELEPYPAEKVTNSKPWELDGEAMPQDAVELDDGSPTVRHELDGKS